MKDEDFHPCNVDGRGNYIPKIGVISDKSIAGPFGIVHVSLIDKLCNMYHSQARRYLKSLFFTKSDQSSLIRFAKQYAENNRITSLLHEEEDATTRWSALDNTVF